MRRLNTVLLATIAIMVTLQSSSAQTDYVVGNALGWVIPPGGPIVYSTWAANKTFRVGDTLVFNFINGQHDVARVTKANYDACNSSNPLLLLSNSPANVTLNETGAHYFFCAVGNHCNLGQKLAINVSAAASSPAPQPSSPAPQPATPQPSTPAPAPQAGSPSPASAPTPAPSMSPPSTSPPSPSPSTATPPPPSATSPSPPPSVPSSPSPGGNSDTPPPPPTAGNSATSLGVAGLSTTFLSLIVLAFFM